MENIIEYARDVLTASPKRFLQLAEMPVELLRHVPEPNEWSAADVIHHLIDTERAAFPARVECILAGQDFADFNPIAASANWDRTISPKALAEEFASLRLEGLKSLAKVTAADLPKTARHSKLGIVTMSDLLHEWAGHDLMHSVQAERAMMQPLITGTGPWRSYFKDHDVEKK